MSLKTFERILRSFDLKHQFPGHIHLHTIDLHTCGEPLRVLTKGGPKFTSDSVLGKRREMRDQHDWIRQALMYEPRGHADMYGCLLTAPDRPDSDFGVIFMHNEGYSTMCGHAIIALAKLAEELDWKDSASKGQALRIDAPCGQVESIMSAESDPEFLYSFQGVPSFVLETDQLLNVPGYGRISFDIAFGGAFYAYVDADHIDLKLSKHNAANINRLGKLIKSIIKQQGTKITHPYEADLSFLYGVIFYSRKVHMASDYRNVCVFADGEIDRSPTGSGFCGMLALLSHKNDLPRGKSLIIESIIGSRFSGHVKNRLSYAGFSAIIPIVSGSAYITGRHQFLIDPKDPMKNGFLLR
ncbi:MAG: proline racemase [Saprospiraceae bacterium]|nr:proline racemase [Saprospiraceae bacterium]